MRHPWQQWSRQPWLRELGGWLCILALLGILLWNGLVIGVIQPN